MAIGIGRGYFKTDPDQCPTGMKPTPDINLILALPENNAASRFGAEMGRRDRIEGTSSSLKEPLYLQSVQFLNGDYDSRGAYWGGLNPLWCAFSADGTTRIFVRAKDRREAKAEVRKRSSSSLTYFE